MADRVGRIAKIRRGLSPAEWARTGGMAAAIIGLNVLGWGMLTAALGGHYHISKTTVFGVGTGALAYTLGMRHAFDGRPRHCGPVRRRAGRWRPGGPGAVAGAVAQPGLLRAAARQPGTAGAERHDRGHGRRRAGLGRRPRAGRARPWWPTRAWPPPSCWPSRW
jgi:hypothetical protein